MKLKYKFILFIVLIHLVLIFLSYQLLEDHKYLFLLSELFLLITITISIYIYKEFIRPVNLISQGIESMKDQDFNTSFVKVGQYEMDKLIEMYNQMMSQMREERIKHREQFYLLSQLIQASPSGIVLLDFDNNITSINPSAEKLLRINTENIVGKKLSQLPGDFFSELDAIKTDESKIIKINGIEAYKCQKSHFVDRGFHHHFILIVELTEQILKTEKKAYDKVIRMMSHEINNSIGAINSILNSVLNYKNQLNNEDSFDYENALKVAIERNDKLNHFMGNFADVVRTPLPTKENTDLHKILQNVSVLMEMECEKRNIKVIWQLSKKPFLVKIDVQQIEQALINILKNSMEAIKENGEIVIQTETTPVSKLSIIDNGCGIAKDIQQQLFSPFFSTKKDGQGIGLTLIREILINHGFFFTLNSNNGNTEFMIEFRD